MSFIRTKIICTIGPAVASYEKMLALMEAGMNVARLNFSHGTYEEHARNIENLKKVRQKLGKPLAILVDIKGPEIRIGQVPGGSLSIQEGQRFKLVQTASTPDEISMHPIEALEAVVPGMQILFDDGNLISKVIEARGSSVVIEFQNTGLLKSGKGMNMPEAHLTLPSMTEKDKRDLKFSCEMGVDLIAASFICSVHHLRSVKEFLFEQWKSEIPVIAKIENKRGVENFDGIVQVADGIMVARGDLGVEVDLALVPKLQKMMIRKCYLACKPCITATQMLESMMVNPRPTRAEVSDVANAIYDSSSAIMLSGESAAGKYPIEAVRCMRRIVQETEADFNYRFFFDQHSQHDYHDHSSAVAMAAVKTGYSTNAKAIFVFTTSGMTARLISRLRPQMPVIAVTPSEAVYQQLALNWGVFSVLCPTCHNVREAFFAASQYALNVRMIAFGDVVIVTAGTLFGKRGTTNMMTVVSIGEVLVRGHSGPGRKVVGKIAIVHSSEECNTDSFDGQIVVISHCDASFLPIFKTAAGVILQDHIGDLASGKYALMAAKTFDLPLICRADGAMSLLQDGEEVTLDPKRGLVYRGSEELQASCPF